MIATPQIDTEQAKNVVVYQIPQPIYSELGVCDWEESDDSLSFLLNSLDKQHKSADYFLYCSDIFSVLIQFNKIRKLYLENKEIFHVSFNHFLRNFIEMSDSMQMLLPESAKCVTEVSKVDETIFNYYEFEDKKIFFNLYFDEEGSDSSALVNIKSDSGFLSIEGTIKETVEYLKDYINPTSDETIS